MRRLCSHIPISSGVGTFISFILLFSSAAGQGYDVTGRAFDDTGKKMGPIRVVLYDQDKKKVIEVETPNSGKFKLKNIPDGKYTLNIYGPDGYGITENISVSGAKISDLEPRLNPYPDQVQLKTEAAGNGASIDWQGISGAAEYIVYRDNKDVATVGETFYLDEVEPGQSYAYNVVAIKTDKSMGGRSITEYGKSLMAPPENLSSEAKKNTVKLTWDAVNGVQYAAPTGPLVPDPGDRIVIVGNTFAERMGQFGHFETLLQDAYPDHALIVRNLGWSGDTPTIQPRPLDFGTMEEHLVRQEADVIIACFGMNESFDGEPGRAAFEESLREFIASMRDLKPGGGLPELLLVGPIAHEQLGGQFPEAEPHNADLEAYTASMRMVAAEQGVRFVDLHAPSDALWSDPEGPGACTINGIHLNEQGNRLLSEHLRCPVAIKTEAALAILGSMMSA